MGNSTISVQDTLDLIATMGDVNPQANPGAYATTLVLVIANDTMSDLVSRRFNFKWNSKDATPFLTNSWQQDYPQLGLNDVAWLENGVWVDINSTSLPLPSDEILAVDNLLRSSGAVYGSSLLTGPPSRICWKYNRQLVYGPWPGASKLYSPLLTQTPTPANGPMAWKDSNGNILTLTTFGTTGTVAVAAPANSPEGTLLDDGSVVWTVVDPNGQGFRIYPLPPSGGPVYQICPVYQMQSVKILTLDQTLDPMPDDYAQGYRRGFKCHALEYSADPKVRMGFEQARVDWLKGVEDAMEQGNREAEEFRMVPATQVVDEWYGRRRNPRDPGQPL